MTPPDRARTRPRRRRAVGGGKSHLGRGALRGLRGRVERPAARRRRRGRGRRRGQRRRVRGARRDRRPPASAAGSPRSSTRSGLDPARRRRWLELARPNDVPGRGGGLHDAARGMPRAQPGPGPAAARGPARRASCGAWPSSAPASPTRASTRCTSRSPAGCPRRGSAAQARPRPARRSGRSGCGSACTSRRSPAGGAAGMRERLAASPPRPRPRASRASGVMDHFRQIPQVGRDWEDLPECFTTLGYLAAATSGRASARWSPAITLPQRRAPGQDGRDARRAERRPGRVRPRDRLARGRGPGLRARRSRRAPSATPCSRTPCRPCRCCGARAPRPSPAASCRSRRPCATRGRCRRASRCSSAARASGGRCGSSPATPTGRTCSATRPPSGASSRCCTRTAPRRAATRRRSRSPTSPPPWLRRLPTRPPSSAARLRPGRVLARPLRRLGQRGHVDDHVGRFRTLAEAGVQTAIVRLADLGRDPGAIERFAPVINAFL